MKQTTTGGNLHHEYTCTVLKNQLFIHYCIVHAWLASEINYLSKENLGSTIQYSTIFKNPLIGVE